MALADVVLPAQVIRPRAIITPDQIVVRGVTVAGAIADPEKVIGMEARVALYPGRPIRLQDVGAPAIIERNQLVSLVFENNFLNIATEGRALGRAAVGESLRVMNLSSRATVVGTVMADGRILVNP